MNKLAFALLFIGMVVMLSFIAPHIYKANKEFFKTGKAPVKMIFNYIAVVIVSVICFAVFAFLVMFF